LFQFVVKHVKMLMTLVTVQI